MNKPNTPNILLIISDQQRVETLGHLGRTPCKTPHIDQLAATGVSFDRCVTPCPLCAPARAGIFTGKHPHQVRARRESQSKEWGKIQGMMYDQDAGIDMLMNVCSPDEQMPFTSPLHERGYVLDYVGKWHLGDQNLTANFDRYAANATKDWPAGGGNWAFLSDDRVVTKTLPRMSIPTPVVDPLPADKSLDAWIADTAIEHLRDLPTDKPFFLTCSFIGPHPPFKVPEPYFNMYDPAGIPEPPNFRPNQKERNCNQDNYYRHICNDFGTDWEAWKKAYAVYWGFCTHIDHQTGRVVNALEELGLRENTLVVYCSDHGELLGTHGLWQKYEPYEEDLRVPLVFSAPWLEQDRVSGATVSLLDIMPTLLNQTGGEVSGTFEGCDLSNLLEHGISDHFDNRYVFSAHKSLGSFHNTVDWRLVTDNVWKYVWNNGDLDELFDLQADPYETQNLIDSENTEGILRELREILRDQMSHTGDPLLEDFLSG